MPQVSQPNAGYIDDGYTRTDLFPATKRHPETRVTYRPVTARERRLLVVTNQRHSEDGIAGAGKIVDNVIALVAGKLIEWNVVGSDGTPTPINPDTFAALEPNLYDAIQSAVLGFDDGKVDPEFAKREADAAKN